MRRVIYILAIVFLSAIDCAAQICAHYPKTPVQTSSGQAVPFPIVRVCAEPATGLTCTPLVNLFSDRACTQALPNPMTGDARGNVDFYTPAARVHLQEKGSFISQIDIADVSVADPLQPVWAAQAQQTCSSTVAWDTGVSTIFNTLLTGNCTASVANAVIGRVIQVKIVQDGVGARTLTWPGSFANTCTIAPGVNAVTAASFWFDGTTWNLFGGCGGSSQFIAPSSPGATTTTSGAIVFDSTNKNYHFGGNGVDNIGALVPSSVTITNGDCPKWSLISGTVTLGDTGGPCSSPLTIAATANNFLTSYTAATGAFTQARPSFANLSGSLASTQLPNPLASTRIVDGVTFTTIQSAITDACANTPHASVFIPAGNYTQNTPLVLCSNLEIAGAGANGPATVGGTKIATTMTSGTLFQLGGSVDVHIHDLWASDSNAGPGGSAVCVGDNTGTNSTSWTQGAVIERFYCDGGFARGVDLEVFKASAGSSITNTFRDFQVTITLPGSVGCDLNANDVDGSTDKVINGNTFQNGICSGGSAGSFGMRTIGGTGGGNTYINENSFNNVQFYTGNGLGSAGVFLAVNSSSDTNIINATIEGNATGIKASSGIQAVCISCEVAVNTLNIDDSFQGVTFIRGRGTQLALQKLYFDMVGNAEVNGLGMGVLPQAKTLSISEGGTPVGVGNQVVCYADASAHAMKCSYNNDNFNTVPRIVASGTATFANSSLTTGTCSATVTVAATNTLTTDRIVWSYLVPPTGTHEGMLIVNPWPTANNVNFMQCNPGAGTIVRDGLSVTWAVMRP